VSVITFKLFADTPFSNAGITVASANKTPRSFIIKE
jgi:hypothetical protein